MLGKPWSSRPKKETKGSKSNAPYHPLEFQFITSTGPQDDEFKGPEANRWVKSHVMRRFHQEKRRSRTTIPGRHDLPIRGHDRELYLTSTLQAEVRELNDSDSSIYHNVSWPDRNYGRSGFPLKHFINYSMALVRTPLDTSKSDPFGCLPVEIDRGSNFLLDFYSEMHSSGSGPNDPRKISLTVLLSHPATMHGILVVSALLYKQNISNPNVVAAEYYRHMIGAISAVNKALDDPIERYSDAIVGAIMLLARNEFLMKNVEGASNHFRALQKIVKTRGGLQTLGWDGMLARLIFWVDNFWASLTITTPRFPVVIIENQTPEAGTYIITLKSADVGATVSTLIDLNDVLRALKTLSLENDLRPTGSPYGFVKHYSDKLISLEHYLSTCILDKYNKNDINSCQQISTADAAEHSFYLAALMYLYKALRELPIVTHVVFSLILLRLKEAVVQLCQNPIVPAMAAAKTPDSAIVLFWTLFAGCVCGEGGPHEQYFRHLLYKLSVQLNVRSWDEAKVHLQAVAWVSRVCEEPWKSVWDKGEHEKLVLN